MNISRTQQKITRINQCCGCRSCSQACPQGIDVSREIYNNNGKVTNRECIKCYNCIDACDDNVLRDTSRPAVAQQEVIKGYEKHPWQKSGLRRDGYINASGHLQAIQPLGPVGDFMSIVIALIGGGITSQFGGFWFYPGAVLSFLSCRMIFLLARKLLLQTKPVTT